MTVLLSRAAQQYAKRAQPYVVAANVPAGLAKRLRWVDIRIVPSGPWPSGLIAKVTLTSPVGTQEATFEGATLFSRTPVRSVKFEYDTADDVMPAGAYSLAFEVLQALPDVAVSVDYGT